MVRTFNVVGIADMKRGRERGVEGLGELTRGELGEMGRGFFSSPCKPVRNFGVTTLLAALDRGETSFRSEIESRL